MRNYNKYETFKNSEPFTGKTILITGSSRGIGFAIAKAFSRYNCTVVITGKNETNLSKAAEKLSNTACDLISISGDLSSENGVNTLYKEVIHRVKKIDKSFRLI